MAVREEIESVWPAARAPMVLAAAPDDASEEERDAPTIPVRGSRGSGVVSGERDAADPELLDEDAVDDDAIIPLPYSRRAVQRPDDEAMVELPSDEVIGRGIPVARLPTFDDEVIGLPDDGQQPVSHHEIPPPPFADDWDEDEFDPEMDEADLDDMVIYPTRD